MSLFMVIVTSLIVLVTVYYKSLVRLHAQIQGQWLTFLPVFVRLWWRKRKHPRGRLDVYRLYKDTLEDMAWTPFPQALENSMPKKDKPEDLYIYGFNGTDRSRLCVEFKRRPLPAATRQAELKDKVSIDFSLEDGKGNTYWLKEETVVDFCGHEYRASGWAFEELAPNKTGRIKFRGYMHKNDDTTRLYYVRIRLLTLFYSRTYDHQRVFDANFLAQEVMHTGGLSEPNKVLEDRIEQYCHIKGTIQVEGEDVEDELDNEVHFLAFVGRRYLPTQRQAPKRFIRLTGVDKEGVLVQLGLIQIGNTCLRLGVLSVRGQWFQSLTGLSLTKSDFKELSNKKKDVLKFTATFEGEYEFEVKLAKGSRWWTGKINGTQASGMLEDLSYDEIDEQVRRTPSPEALRKKMEDKLVVPFEEELASHVELTGGKGASLAQLSQLAQTSGGHFQVPDGLVVTTSAFQDQILSMSNFFSKLANLEAVANAKELNRSALEERCGEFVSWFEGHPLRESIRTQLEQALRTKFGNDFEKIKFSVRSSASLEDSSEMSAAGQMKTYLGVRGLSSLAEAVVKCWASQFGFVPIEYKRGYGQELNSPMAVVVQQMVNCEVAGVVFTANPIDGDERLVTITSNFGLGESVVLAAADPDTFQVAVQIDRNGVEADRPVKDIVSRTLGKKSLVTRMHEDDDREGVEDVVSIDNTNVASLTDEQVLALSKLAVLVHRHYGNARDIEWGHKEGQWYMLQSRPITNLDSSFTEYELMHEMDTPHMTEYEIYSRNHWGENFPGASSWLGTGLFNNNLIFARGQITSGVGVGEKHYGPYRPPMGYVTNSLFFNCKVGEFSAIFSGYPEDDIARGIVLAFFGRDLTDPEVVTAFQMHRRKRGWMERLQFIKMLVDMLFLGPIKLKRVKKFVFEQHGTEIAGFMHNVPLSDQLDYLVTALLDRFKVNTVHSLVSFGSSVKNMMLIKLLKSCNDDEGAVFRDYNLLLSQCNDVVSAEVPNMLREIALAIQHRALVASMSDEEVLAYIRSEKGEAGKLFQRFLQKHGHRSYREMDPMYLSWDREPIVCMRVIKSMLNGLDSYQPKARKTPEQLMTEIETTMPTWKRLLITKLILPACHNAVGYRENSKSIMVDSMGRAYWTLAENMHAAGYIPEAELLFYMKIDEIARLLKGDRNPMLLMKAKQRRRLYPTMNKYKYEEFVKGFRMRPRKHKKVPVTIGEGAVSLKGTAVTVGAIKARICVAETIEEATAVEQGDILVTYSTDIGWSPYFPLISGIITEIGGTISHGAIIAREFGIPCLIAVEGACAVFKTGDIGYLDTKTGTLTKVEE